MPKRASCTLRFISCWSEHNHGNTCNQYFASIESSQCQDHFSNLRHNEVKH